MLKDVIEKKKQLYKKIQNKEKTIKRIRNRLYIRTYKRTFYIFGLKNEIKKKIHKRIAIFFLKNKN